MSNRDYYPAGTWEGDPRAPWNKPDPPECAECRADLDPFWDYCPWCGAKATHYGGDEEGACS